MNRKTTEADLLYYLKDPMVGVIAFKGLWGTGKTHLWEGISVDFPPINDNDHLYASCFGLESLDQIKVALFQSSLGKAEKAVTLAKRLSSFTLDFVETVSTKFVPGAEGVATVIGGFSDLVQSTMIDKVLQSRLIVLDDIERRSNSLQVGTLLGFIDLLKRNNCKILLILNEEPLEESSAADWRTLKEKSIDREISLLTTSIEAAEIGLSGDCVYRKLVTDTLSQLKVTNIRVIQRIERGVNTIFGGKGQLSYKLIESMLPAVVAFTALNFNAVPGGPDLTSLMKEWSEWCAQLAYLEGNQSVMSDAVAFSIKMDLTKDFDFLELLMQHIQTGHRLEGKFQSLFEDRQEHNEFEEAENAAFQYINDSFTDPHMSNEDFIQLASDFKRKWHKLPPDKVSAIAWDLERRGDQALAKEIASAWARAWGTAPKQWNSNLHSVDGFYQEVREAILKGNHSLSGIPPLLDSVLKVANGEWSVSHTSSINNATKDEVIKTILELDKTNFAKFVHFYRGQIKKPILDTGGASPLFKNGVETFLSAVRQIVKDKTKPRLIELLEMYFSQQLIAENPIEEDCDSELNG